MPSISLIVFSATLAVFYLYAGWKFSCIALDIKNDFMIFCVKMRANTPKIGGLLKYAPLFIWPELLLFDQSFLSQILYAKNKTRTDKIIFIILFLLWPLKMATNIFLIAIVATIFIAACLLKA